MKYQVFVPLVALQIVNLFWYFLMWRIALRFVISNLNIRIDCWIRISAVFQSKLEDERSDDEGDGEDKEEVDKEATYRKANGHATANGVAKRKGHASN